jgi:phage portal protein BeeE
MGGVVARSRGSGAAPAAPGPGRPAGPRHRAAFSLGDELDSDEYIARFTKNSFWNNTIPPFIAGIEGANDVEAPLAKFKEELRRRHSGPENAGKLLITNGKVSIARLDTSFKDLALVDVRKFLMGFVRMVYRVPPEIVGDVTSEQQGDRVRRAREPRRAVHGPAPRVPAVVLPEVADADV